MVLYFKQDIQILVVWLIFMVKVFEKNYLKDVLRWKLVSLRVNPYLLEIFIIGNENDLVHYNHHSQTSHSKILT